MYHVHGLYDLEMELLKFTPKSSIHDDIIDALAYVSDIAFEPEESEEQKKDAPEMHKSPAYLIAATEAWREYGRGTFQEFVEDWDSEEAEEIFEVSPDHFERRSIME